jgi:hypothetical protein
MPKFGKTSTARLATCHPKLQEIMNEAIKRTDFSILCGHRSKEDQDAAVKAGNSKAVWPKSRHNSTPSMAVDVAPYPLNWENAKAFMDLAKVIKEVAKEKGIAIRWGGDFKTLVDLPHIELV